MRNFSRVLRIALKYRSRYILAVLCALVAAVLFGGNFGTVLPAMKVLLYEKTLQDYVAEKVHEREQEIENLRGQISAPKREETGSEKTGQAMTNEPVNASTESRLEILRLNLQRKEVKFEWYRRLQHLVDRYVPRDRYRTLVFILVVIMAGFMLNSLFDFANEMLVASVTELSLMDLRNQFYHHVMRMELSSFTRQSTSELMARFTNDMKSLSMGVELLLGKVLREPLKAIACITLAGLLNWRLTLLALVLVPAATALMMVIGLKIRRAARRCLESAASIYQVLQETFQGIKVVKAFTMEPYERMRFYRQTSSFYRKSMRVALIEALAAPVMGMVALSTVLIALLAGFYLVTAKQTHILGIRFADAVMDAESLLLLYLFLVGVGDPIRKLSNVYAKLQKSAASADRIYAFLDIKPVIVTRLGAPRIRRHRESVELAGVHFSYTASHPILKDINLKASFGETVALVGPNGCGKTTLVSLLTRFYDPLEGQVLIDGVDIREVQRRSLRQQFGIVAQETILFNDTVYRNIAYGNPRASQAQVEAAAKKAHALGFIEQLPQGYDTIVGERAVKLSGGQRQRIALARALLRDPAILILDEATSALDVESESLIHKVLTEFLHDRTTFLITHRLASLQLADRIIVMNEGRIQDQGTHEELLRRCPLYSRLHEIHMSDQYLSAG